MILNDAKELSILRNCAAAFLMLAVVAPWTDCNTLNAISLSCVYSTGSCCTWDVGGVNESSGFPELVSALDSIPLTRSFEIDADRFY